MHDLFIGTFVSDWCRYSIFKQQELIFEMKFVPLPPLECRCLLPPDAPKLPYCKPGAHPFVHQHVYSWHNSHCGTSRSCRGKSGRVLCISKLTTCQRQTHKRIIWGKRWWWRGEGGFKLTPPNADRKWTPEDLHVAIHSRSLDKVTAGASHVSPQINCLFCMDGLQRGASSESRRGGDSGTPPPMAVHYLASPD